MLNGFYLYPGTKSWINLKFGFFALMRTASIDCATVNILIKAPKISHLLCPHRGFPQVLYRPFYIFYNERRLIARLYSRCLCLTGLWWCIIIPNMWVHLFHPFPSLTFLHFHFFPGLILLCLFCIIINEILFGCKHTLPNTFTTLNSCWTRLAANAFLIVDN